jgi:hypothetical protein
MKSVKPFLIGRGAKKLGKMSKSEFLGEGLWEDFGGVNAQEPAPIDALLMPILTAALRPLPIEAISDAFLQRGLLPRTVISGLNMARFLSLALLPARAAQECFGIRASILLADAHRIAGVWMDKYVGDSNDVFETGERFSNITEAFGMRAEWMKKNRKFRAVMRAMHDPKKCLEQLGCCELWNEEERAERVETIICYGLQECDTLIRKHSSVTAGAAS